MLTKVVSFLIFFQELSNKKTIKALRPKMTEIASRGGGGSCLKSEASCQEETFAWHWIASFSHWKRSRIPKNVDME